MHFIAVEIVSFKYSTWPLAEFHPSFYFPVSNVVAR